MSLDDDAFIVPTGAQHPERDGEGSARREHSYPPYMLMHWSAIRRLAEVFAEGAEKYGVDNWKRGGPSFIADLPSHVIEHLIAYSEGDTTEDHLAHAMWNIMAMMYFQEKKWEETQELVPTIVGQTGELKRDSSSDHLTLLKPAQGSPSLTELHTTLSPHSDRGSTE